MKKGQKRGGMSLKGGNVTLRVFRAIWWGHFCQTAWTPVFCNSPSKSMFWHFWPFFDIFWWFWVLHFIIFFTFPFSDFVTFSGFCIFSILTLFHVFDDFTENTIFNCFSSFFNFENSRVKIRPSFDPFCPPSSTPMASTWWCSILNGDFFSLFFDILTHFWSFLVIFCRFFNFAIKNSLFLIIFWPIFVIIFYWFLSFLRNFSHFFEF